MGLTTSYGNETPAQPMTSTGSFSAPLAGLTPGITYHFRAKAVGDGTAYGTDSTFGQGTTTPPPAPTLLSPANGANAPGTSVTFQWNPSPGPPSTSSLSAPTPA